VINEPNAADVDGKSRLVLFVKCGRASSILLFFACAAV